MNLIINDDLKMAYVQDFDQTEWDAQSSSIPADYAITISPPIAEETLAAIAGTRTPLTFPQLTYQTQTLGNGIISIPTTITIQQLIVPSQDEQPTA